MYFSTTLLTTLLTLAPLVSSTCPKDPPGIAAFRKTRAQNAFSTNKIAPGVVAGSFNPTLDVIPAYGKKIVNFGNIFSTTETLSDPTIAFSAEKAYDPAKTNYTVILVDPDAPSPNAPALRFFLHRINYNAHPTCTGTGPGTVKTPYLSLTPLSVAAHRYIFLVFRQPKGPFEPQVPVLAQAGRAPFDVPKFIKDNKLTLVGGNFMKEGLNSIGARDEVAETLEDLE